MMLTPIQTASSEPDAMFTKKDTPPPAPTTSAAPEQAPASPKRNAMKSKAPSILSADLTVTGSLSSDGEVQLDGNVEGDVQAASLTIGEEASINGEVVAENVVIRGRVNGSVRARQVQLAATARVEGDIVHATLAIESGAFFDGHCKRSSDPIADSKKTAGASAKPAEKSAPPSPSAPPSAAAASTAGGSAQGSSGKTGDAFGSKS